LTAEELTEAGAVLATGDAYRLGGVPRGVG
jgi:hypothetical protein